MIHHIRMIKQDGTKPKRKHLSNQKDHSNKSILGRIKALLTLTNINK